MWACAFKLSQAARIVELGKLLADSLVMSIRRHMQSHIAQEVLRDTMRSSTAEKTEEIEGCEVVH